MIVDTSAIVAIFRREDEVDRFSEIIADEPLCKMSASSVLELSITLTTIEDPISSTTIDLFIKHANIEIVPFSVLQAYLARAAHYRFGKKSGHPAMLNFGDCMCYALAKELDEPLLFKGDDFIHTDVRIAFKS